MLLVFVQDRYMSNFILILVDIQSSKSIIYWRCFLSSSLCFWLLCQLLDDWKYMYWWLGLQFCFINLWFLWQRHTGFYGYSSAYYLENWHGLPSSIVLSVQDCFGCIGSFVFHINFWTDFLFYFCEERDGYFDWGGRESVNSFFFNGQFPQ